MSHFKRVESDFIQNWEEVDGPFDPRRRNHSRNDRMDSKLGKLEHGSFQDPDKTFSIGSWNVPRDENPRSNPCQTESSTPLAESEPFNDPLNPNNNAPRGWFA